MECPFCKETIQDGAVKCKHCQSMLAPQQEHTTTSSYSGANDDAEDNAFHWFLEPFRKYAVFTGRARRKEYWYFFLFNLIISFALSLIGDSMGIGDLLSNLYSLGVFLPSVAVGVRRLHDTDRSGWWLLLPIVNLVLLAQDTKAGVNRFGNSPKAVVADGTT